VASPDADVSTARTLSKGHGRIEVRSAQSCELLSRLLQSWGFVNARQVVRVERVRRIKGAESREVEYYQTSLGSARATALDLLSWIRKHWAIENRLHHVRDVTFDEDRCRVRKGNSAEVLAALRKVAIHLLHGVDAVSTRAATYRFQVRPDEAIDLLKSTQLEQRNSPDSAAQRPATRIFTPRKAAGNRCAGPRRQHFPGVRNI
jgi:predicted transposase YbfD/YdcC